MVKYASHLFLKLSFVHSVSLQARVIFQKGTNVAYIKVEDLASVWCEWAEMELRHEYVELCSLILPFNYRFLLSFHFLNMHLSYLIL